MAGHIKAFSKLLKSALIAAIAGLTLLVVGILSPAWVSNPGRDNWVVKEGIWFSRVCRQAGGPCIVSSRTWILQEYGNIKRHTVYETLNWTEFQILTAGSLTGGVVAVITLLLSLRKAGPSYTLPILVISGCAALVSCVGTLVPVLKLSVVVQEGRPDKTWSRLVATCGSIVQFVTSILIVFTVSQVCIRNIKSKTEQSGTNTNQAHRVSRNEDFVQMDTLPSRTTTSRHFYDSRSMHAAEGYMYKTDDGWEPAPPYMEGLPVYAECTGSVPIT